MLNSYLGIPADRKQRARPVQDEKPATDVTRTRGSDYSATSLVGALQIYELVIWADLGGLCTADP
jgi:aspartokinase